MNDLPHSFEAEQALLGAIIADNRVYEQAIEVLRPEHFADPSHGRLFEVIGKMIDKGERADAVTLAPRMVDPLIGRDLAYLANLVRAMVTIKSAVSYAEQIAELHNRREIILACRRAEREAFEVDAANAAEHLEYALSGLSETQERTVQSIAESMPATVADIVEKRDEGIRTGLRAIDEIVGALYPADLTIIAGRPAMGKTALAMTMATKVCKAAPVAFFSLEMSTAQLNRRLISMGANIPAVRMRTGNLDHDEIRRIREAAERASALRILVDDTPDVSALTIRARAKKIQRQVGLGMVIIDYLQLMQANNRYAGNKVAEITEISRNLKILAKELYVPVVVLSQLSRQVEQRENKRPNLSDLRESGAIEQDADNVMFCYRDEYYLANDAPEEKPGEGKIKFAARMADHEDRMVKARGKAEIIVAKQRSGPTGTAVLSWDGQRTMFGDLT